MQLDDTSPPEPVDIRGYSFERFVEFVFHHEVPANYVSSQGGAWYWSIAVDFDHEAVCDHYIHLFRQPEFLRDTYLDLELDQAFWAIQSANLECSAERIVWDTRLPFETRAEVIRSMYDLFARLFVQTSLQTAVYMWWDSLCYDWDCGNRRRERGGEDQQMQDVMFATLERVLSLPVQHCQLAALHGLGHLHHPDTPVLVSQFLANNLSVNEDLKTYALAASRFQVL